MSWFSHWPHSRPRRFRPDGCRGDRAALRRVEVKLLLDNGYAELPIESAHAVAVEALPPIHKDSFDRILVAQAQVEGLTLLALDPVVAKYPGPVRLAG